MNGVPRPLKEGAGGANLFTGSGGANLFTGSRVLEYIEKQEKYCRTKANSPREGVTPICATSEGARSLHLSAPRHRTSRCALAGVYQSDLTINSSQQSWNFGHWDRFPDKVPLRFITSESAQIVELVKGFDAFGCYVDSKLMRQIHE